MSRFSRSGAGASTGFAGATGSTIPLPHRAYQKADGSDYTALPRPLFAFAFVIYVWKVVVWDKVLALGSTDPLSGDVAHWATIVLTAYFGGRSIEKVARILTRK